MAGTHAYWLSHFKYLMMKWFDNTFKGTSSQHKDKKAPNSPSVWPGWSAAGGASCWVLAPTRGGRG